MAESIDVRPIEDELTDSYLTYSLSVIIGRAIPDVRDGLKPVQRRIIYSMMELRLFHNAPFKKSARIVGEVMGKYHPHGDAAIYDALVRMAQNFSVRYPLIDGQGNFGSIDRDPPAAMRYTEARLSEIAEELLRDIDKNTVDMVPNFDNTLQEPEVLPATIPLLLLNGASGIAVGMATNIPPHNLREVVDAIVAFIDNPNIKVEKLFEYVKGPDFPTGGMVIFSKEMRNFYLTGRGKFTIKGKAFIENTKSGPRIVITEIPYGVSKADLITQIARYAQKDDSIRGLRDESDKHGIRVVVELRKNCVPQIVLNRLYVHTSLQVTFGGHMLVIDEHKRPRLMNLKGVIGAFVAHRFKVTTRRIEYELDKATKRAHIIEGLMKATRSISTVVDMIRMARTVEDARKTLMEVLEVTREQADAILEMRLSRLTSLETEKLAQEYAQLNEKIKEYKDLLENPLKIYGLIKEELLALKDKYGDDRRTEIVYEYKEMEVEDLISDDEIVVMVTKEGYLKVTNLSDYRRQSRGGKGLVGMRTGGNDYVEHVLVTTRLSKTAFITNKGKVYILDNHIVDLSSRDTRGKVIQNYLKIESDEKIKALIRIPRNVDDQGDVVFFTKMGKVKRTPLKAFSNVRSNGIKAIGLGEKDEVISAFVLPAGNEDMTLLVATKMGQAVRFFTSQVRKMGRTAAGVTAIKLTENDEVVSAIPVNPQKEYILTITEKGYGKRSKVSEYPVHNRGGKGIRNITNLNKVGGVVGVLNVGDEEEILVVSKSGKTIRFPVKDIRITGRSTQGVKIMTIGENDEISSVSMVE